MQEVNIVDSKKPIVMLKYSGHVTDKDVLDASQGLRDAYKQLGEKYYFLVDLSDFRVFTRKAQDLIVEQQIEFLNQIHCVGVVAQSVLTTLQLKEINEKSDNDKETYFRTYDEAFNFLKKL